MTSPRFASAVLVAVIATIVASAQQPPLPQAAATPLLPPSRGTLAIGREAADAIRAAIRAPAGFMVTAFAAADRELSRMRDRVARWRGLRLRRSQRLPANRRWYGLHRPAG